jgi:outer membrane protein W
MDYPLFPWLIFRGMAGLEQFAVGGANDTSTGGCGGECTAEISYLTFDFWGKFNFSQGGFRPWAGAGFDVMFPLTKDSTALDKESITNTSVIAIGGGFDWMLSDTSYLPFQIEYNLYPSSAEVSASAIALRLGYAWGF